MTVHQPPLTRYSMRPAAMPPVSPRARTEDRDLEMGLAQTAHSDTPSPQHAGAQVDARLQGLPQRPVHPEPLRDMPPRKRIARNIANVAGITAAVVGIASVPTPPLAFFGFVNQYDRLAKYSGIATLAGIATTGTLKAIERKASNYANGPTTINGRAEALGTSGEMLHTATLLVTVPDQENNPHPMSDTERLAISKDLQNMSMLDKSVLDPNLLKCVHNAGSDPGKLVDALLQLKRNPPPDTHAAASSSA
ncbi:type III secretion system effector XopAV [Xanthomonas translucens]|uniref:type III secretion system effector XopAV n=4 Tax=Xanthomonas campestris pv. translucens TaxID=343 RepID=UPI0028E0A15A|nr:type III secretion system effector XopAV [Xanthomonas translucens]